MHSLSQTVTVSLIEPKPGVGIPFVVNSSPRASFAINSTRERELSDTPCTSESSRSFSFDCFISESFKGRTSI